MRERGPDIEQASVTEPPARLLGRGVTAEVFALPPDRVLKLLRAGIGEEIARREFAAARAAHAAALPVPEPIALWNRGGRHGIVFERLHEGQVARRLRRWPGPVMATLWAMARLQCRLHRLVPSVATMGAVPVAHPLMTRRCARSLAPPAARDAALAALHDLPVGDRLLHGDLHLGNVMTSGGRLMAVDWAQASIGDPAADVARTELLLRFARYGPWLRDHRWARIGRHGAADWYLWCYRRLSGMPDAAIDRWRLPVAVAWLRADSAAHAPALSAFIARRLIAAQSR